MKKSAIQEAYDHADAARLNLETAFSRKEHAGLIRNARQQLAKASKILEDAEFAAAQEKLQEEPELEQRKPANHALEKLVTWTKAPGGIELAQLGVYQLSITGMKGDWYFSVAKAGRRDPVRQGNVKTKRLAKLEAVGWADTLADEDEAEREEKRAKGIGFAKLEAALEKTRVAIWDGMKHESSTDKPMTPRDFSNLLDSFVSELCAALDPEAG